MALVRKEEFVSWYAFTAVETDALRSAGGANLAAADLNGNREIANASGFDELGALFDRIANLNPGGSSQAFETGTPGSPTPAGQAYSLVSIHMRQRSGDAEEPLGERRLADVPALRAILDGRKGAKLRRTPGRITVGTGSLQDALNIVATADELGKPSGYRSPFRVNVGTARGTFGPGTETAVRRFQESRPIGNDGVVGKTTLENLEAALADARRILGGSPPTPTPQTSSRFRAPLFQRIAAGTEVMARGARGPEVETLQLTLYSLGFDIGRYFADSSFGGSTETALKTFQRSVPLPDSGVLDSGTLLALDARALAQASQLRSAMLALGSKHIRHRLVVDIAPNRTCRLYVIDRQTDQPVARYLTSPGTADHATQGDRFTILRTLPRKPWIPPNSDWARGLETVPPGINNPMGILKLDFGAYAQYIHGSPKRVEGLLGQPASHGCMRLSPTNILDLFERYAESGSEVRINRNVAQSQALDAASQDLGITDRPLDAGREYLAGYVSGELGREEAWRSGRTVLVA